MTHICVGKLTIIGSDNGLSPAWRQAIIWTNAGILLIGPLGTNFSEILIRIQTFSFTKMHLKMLSAKWRPFCLGLNVFRKHVAPNRWQATGLDAWASRVKCPARFVSHLHEICIYIYELFIAFVFLLVVHYCNLMVCVVYWVGKWWSRGSTGMFGNLMAIYHIMLQFIQNHYKSTFS